MRWFVRFLSFILLTSMLGTSAMAQQNPSAMSLQSISAPYAERMTFTANSTWNTVAEEWMFYMGMTWSPK